MRPLLAWTPASSPTSTSRVPAYPSRLSVVAAARSSRSRVRSDFVGSVFGAGTGSPYRDGRLAPELALRPPRLISWETMTLRWISLVPSPTIISGASRKYRSTSNSVE
jgi:hypothetical protein